ncbi:methionine ABC transporter ATP-binding protein [Gulosibacter chungangensis]|uniref:Methionine ABC transporter ATP-binding protein n=1 Tax=Gulosibacter chungangensis TaxID=979746 RepID=A0A7J5BG61_9MICO|nr:methionine ABC transporter ATP-binding protein [Gulosibacter chungangensis]KAB1645273.1 methionine ABC transporter ATP-binding protein [Gulosibacter chungangensis]
MAMISMRDVVKEYPSAKRGGDPIRAVDGVSLDINPGDIFGVIGYSGAGKSTLVRLINALEPSTSGVIEVDGTDITQLSESRLQKVRTDIGMIFQQFNLFNSRNVAANVAFPLNVANYPKENRAARVKELLDFVGLADKARAYPDQLSGGQKQRVGIARALSTSPKILLADESTSALDPQTTSDVLDLLERVNRELGVTIVVITHEMDVIKRIASHVAVMEKGKVVEQGEVFDIFSKPQHPATQRFVSTIIPGIPGDRELADLRSRHTGLLATVTVNDEQTAQHEVLRRLLASGANAQLVYGGMNEVSGRSFGHLTFELTGEDAQIRESLAQVSQIASVTTLEGANRA